MPHPPWDQSYASGQPPWDTGVAEPLLVEFVHLGGYFPANEVYAAAVVVNDVV